MPKIEVSEKTVALLIRTLTEQRDELDAQIKQLTTFSGGDGVSKKGGEHSGGKKPRKGRKKAAKAKGNYKDVPNKTALIDLLKKADDKTMARKQLNAAGYSLNSAIEIAKDDKATFNCEKNGAQGWVALKK